MIKFQKIKTHNIDGHKSKTKPTQIGACHQIH